MIPHRFKLFAVLGTPFWLHVSWFPLAPLIAFALAYIVFPTLVPELPAAAYWGMALAGTLGVLLSVILRELIQAFVCKLRGVQTGGVTLAVLGGAWQMTIRDVRASDEVYLTVSGLTGSLGIGAALIFVLFGTVTIATPLAVAGVMVFLAVFNGGLAAVNLLPVYPLGTGRLLRVAFVKRNSSAARATRVAAALGTLIGIAAAAAGVVAIARDALILGAWFVLVGTIVCWFALAAYHDVAGDTRNPPTG